MNRDQKSGLVSILRDKLTSSAFVSIIHYRGMSDKQLYSLRVALKAKGCNIKIAKNTLVRVAIKGTELEPLTSHINGPVAILYSQDPVSLAKALSDISKQVDVLKIKVGFFNKSIVSEAAIRDMAKLGSLEEVRSSFVGVLKGAQSNFVRVISAPEKGLATLKTQ
jgi:large subunit ribosomal protein L10